MFNDWKWYYKFVNDIDVELVEGKKSGLSVSYKL